MKSVISHRSLTLLFVMMVMVWHFCGWVLIRFWLHSLLCYPQRVGVEICLQSHTHAWVSVSDGYTCFGARDSTGGVVLATRDGRIVLENTLDARLEVVFKQQLPEVQFHMRSLNCDDVALDHMKISVFRVLKALRVSSSHCQFSNWCVKIMGDCVQIRKRLFPAGGQAVA